MPSVQSNLDRPPRRVDQPASPVDKCTLLERTDVWTLDGGLCVVGQCASDGITDYDYQADCSRHVVHSLGTRPRYEVRRRLLDCQLM